jgi:hypothetical protein
MALLRDAFRRSGSPQLKKCGSLLGRTTMSEPLTITYTLPNDLSAGPLSCAGVDQGDHKALTGRAHTPQIRRAVFGLVRGVLFA